MTFASPKSLAALALLVPLAACGGGEEAPAQGFAPLTYGYLTPLRLDVATLTVDDRATPQGGTDIAARSPVPPAQALGQMAHDRIFPGGGAGQAGFVIDQASILRQGDRLDGRLAVHLDLSSGNRTGHAEAQVSRTTEGDGGTPQSRLYALTKQMMDDMNVELEYQVRHSLQAWLQPDGDTPVPVQVQSLTGSSPLPVPGAASGGAMLPGRPAAIAPPAAMPIPSVAAPSLPAPSVPPVTAPLAVTVAPGGMSPPPGFLTAPAGAVPLPAPATGLQAPTPLVPASPASVPGGTAYPAPALGGATPYPVPYGTVAPNLPPPVYAPMAPAY